jgi:RimJ/RimL family protein N-acetyltransferase
MMPASEQSTLQTARLHLRPLCFDDREAFAALHADPLVMARLSSTLSRPESDALLARLISALQKDDLTPWAVELTERAEFIGLVGLSRPSFEAAFTPCVEVVWRLLSAHWGQGLATEAARASLEFGFSVVKLPEILAWTTADNIASRRVMEKLQMSHDPAEDFDHPRLPAGHPLRRHVLYRVRTAR